jgi:hypothetical protein
MPYLTRSGCALYSKRGNRMSRFQDLAEQLQAQLGRREVILEKRSWPSGITVSCSSCRSAKRTEVLLYEVCAACSSAIHCFVFASTNVS